MLPAPNRLRERSDFASAVRGPGSTRAGSRLLVVHAHRTDARAGCPPRVGFVVSRAVGGAVVRNRTKRRLRALVAQRLAVVPGGVDLVVRANPPAGAASSGELAASLDALWHKVLGRLGGVA
ncbi:ribonuclease P protein component [Phycicoccus sonneratiae]|uniref:Ribonuclease P protein component n=1 Tax=Phycicoccus sonneratiae TaxID=2807628 RepID=A0ABS2CMZ1_9MICO|nr:ribonuclease P protein component [Phycicoccus sonneraticus]MBM6401252.1 ribonuclease P protein component [Phycicoccus sonneraticus]